MVYWGEMLNFIEPVGVVGFAVRVGLVVAGVSVLMYWLRRQWLKRKFQLKEMVVWVVLGWVPVGLLLAMFGLLVIGGEGLIGFVMMPMWVMSLVGVEDLPMLWMVVGVWWVLLMTPLLIGTALGVKYWWSLNGVKLDVGEVFGLLMVGMIVGAGMWLGMVVIDEECNLKMSGFHVMNAHLKDVCSAEKWQEQCPKSLEDLRNYDRVAYDALRSCMKVRYYLDDKGRGTLLVRHGNEILVSDSRFPDRFEMFYLNSDERSYPPAIPGRWELIK